MSRRRRGKNPYEKPDRFTQEARLKGYPARSVFKLDEIQRRTNLLRPGHRVVDLGCYPGSWSKYALQVIGRRGRLVGIDLEAPQGLRGTYLEQGVEDVDLSELRAALGGPADLVLSDMAPATTGDRFGDHVRQVALAEQGLALALELLVPGGHFCAKVFDGEGAHAFVQSVRPHFTRTRRIKPEATRGRSVEFFVVGLERR